MKQHTSRTTLVLLATILTVGAGSWAWVAQSQPNMFWHQRPQTQPPVSMPVYDFSPLVERVKGTVFNLSITAKATSEGESDSNKSTPFRQFPFFHRNDPFAPFRSHPNMRRWNPMVRATGTGFFINAEGYALTNHHVIRHGGQIVAQLDDRREFPVKVIGKAPFLDLALIKVQAPKNVRFAFTYLGNSDQLKVGEPVIAIGNAKGLGLTVTAGIVSARGRVLGSGNYDNYIQTDAAINQGNSGGPLFNRRGEVVGINTAILRDGRGIGFAIPVNIAIQVLPQLRTKGKVERAQLGVMVQNINSNLARSFGLDKPQGALIARVVPNSPAAKAGLKPGDIILRVNERLVSDHNRLPILIAFLIPGQKLTLEVLRNRKKVTFHVTLTKWKDDQTSQTAPEEQSENNDPNKTIESLGVSISSVSPSLQQTHKIKGGVQIVDLKSSSIAAQHGLQQGDVITEVNQTPVKSVTHFKSLVAAIKSGEHLLLRVVRKDSALFVAFPMP